MAFLESYLDRLGMERPVRADLDHLRRLHVAHLERVPFENLSIALDEPISLEHDALPRKILDRGRVSRCWWAAQIALNGLSTSDSAPTAASRSG